MVEHCDRSWEARSHRRSKGRGNSRGVRFLERHRSGGGFQLCFLSLQRAGFASSIIALSVGVASLAFGFQFLPMLRSVSRVVLHRVFAFALIV